MNTNVILMKNIGNETTIFVPQNGTGTEITMKSFTYTVADEHGVHARPAGVIVGCAKNFSSSVTVKRENREANAKRLLSLMGLGAKCGDLLEFFVEGSDEQAAAKELERVCREVLG